MADTKEVKAWTYTTAGYPNTLKFSTTTIPPTPSPGHILIQIHAAALNPVDIQLMNIPLNSLPGLNGPKIAARDFSGTVLSAASDTDWKQGDEVMGVTIASDGTGCLTEIAHLNVKAGSCIIRKPSHMSWTQAASLPLVWLTARTSVERCVPFLKSSTNPSANKVAILGGSSATGLYTINIAKQRGYTVLTSCSHRNTDFVKSLGADEVVDYTTSPTAVVDAVKRFKPNAIVDCVGGTECIGLAEQYVTIVGDKTSRSSMGGSVLYYTHPRMYVRWLMGWLGVGKSYQCIILDLKKGWLEECKELKGEGEIVVDSVFGFERVMEAYERLDTGRARGKVVVEVRKS